MHEMSQNDTMVYESWGADLVLVMRYREWALAMSRFYPDKPDSQPETAWNFLMDRRVRTMANRKSAVSRRAMASVKKIEELIKKGKAR